MAPTADELVTWDDLGAGIGDRIAISEGAEATQPFRPDIKPVDVYNAAILDRIDVKEMKVR
jgi:ethanolamine utilization protein EutN